jgi:hypothetical protein
MEQLDLAVLDYRLGPNTSAVDVATRLRDAYPDVPVLVLSDMMWMPADIAPYACGFVRKGKPELLLQTIASAVRSEGHSSRRD